jgi:hypothetical protein
VGSKYKRITDPETGRITITKKRKRPKAPDTDKPNALIRAVNAGKHIDRRTKAGRQIAEVRDAVRTDLDATARALLEEDVAAAAVIQRACTRAVFKDPDKIIDEGGRPAQALYSWMKFAGVKRSALLALKKFQTKAHEPEAEDLADLVLEVSAGDD